MTDHETASVTRGLLRLFLCLFGHRWVTDTGFRLRGVNWYVGSGLLTCERCGRQR